MFNLLTKCLCSMLFRLFFVLGLFAICYYLCIGNIATSFIIYFTMSKGNLFLGYARGKVGSVVFGRRLGEQIARPYNASPKNPKTRTQMARRVRWANLVNFWRLMKPFISMGMQGRKTTQSDYNKFVGLNVNNSEAYLLKDEARQGATVLAPYILTSGTLGLRNMRSSFVSSVSVGSITDLSDVSIGQLSEAIINNNQNFRVGDQITIFALGQDLIEGLPQVLPFAFKFILRDANELTPALSAIEVFGSVSPAITDGYLAYEFSGSDYPTHGGAVVQSRISIDGVLDVSVSRLAVDFVLGGISQASNPFAVTQNEAMLSYGFVPESFLSPKGAAVLPDVAVIGSATFNGDAVTNGGTYSPDQSSVSVQLIGKGFEKEAPTVTFGGENIAVTVVSDVLATCSFSSPTGSQRPFEARTSASAFNVMVVG